MRILYCLITVLWYLQATVVSDVLVLYVIKGKQYYRTKKYQQVSTPVFEYEVVDHKDADEVLLCGFMHIKHNDYCNYIQHFRIQDLLKSCDKGLVLLMKYRGNG